MKSHDIHAVFSLLLLGQLPVRENGWIPGREAIFNEVVRETR